MNALRNKVSANRSLGDLKIEFENRLKVGKIVRVTEHRYQRNPTKIKKVKKISRTTWQTDW